MRELYPTSILETGWDILFFWVARMVMFGLKLTGDVPFTEVYCHSLIRDAEGRKMSKSLGNVIDPLDIIRGITLDDLHKTLYTGNIDASEIERAKSYQKSAFPKGIEECGADALRFTLVNYTTGGGDIAFDVREIEAKRRFCNKIYQATNFALGRLGEGFSPDATLTDNTSRSLAEKWILHRLNFVAKEVNHAIEKRDFSVSAGTLYQYWFTQLCDTFIENSKYILTPEAPEDERKSAQQTLYTAIEGGLLLMHPLMPFVTEHLWQKLPRRKGDTTESIMIAKYPEFTKELDAPEEAEKYEFIMDIASGVRSLLAQYGFKEPGDLIVQTYSESAFKTCSEEKKSIKSLGGKYAGEIEILPPAADSLPPAGCALQSINAEAAVYLKIVGRIDIADELKKREKSIDDAKARADKSRKIMSGVGWEKANEGTRKKEQEKLQDAESEVNRLEEAVKDLERLKMQS